MKLAVQQEEAIHGLMYLRLYSYNFEFIIDPDTNAMLCNASVISPKGILEDVMKGNCWQNEAW